MRFIDFAKHGGCSKKAPANELRSLLSSVQGHAGSDRLTQIANDFPDVGSFMFDRKNLTSSVDIVLPMVHSPRDFGKIAVLHSLSDLYASLSKPLFSLCILGVPDTLTVDAPVILEMMNAANDCLAEEGVALVGGHTMSAQEDLYIGFCAIGTSITSAKSEEKPEVGDVIVLTKPLGTSVASLRWKMDEANELEHSDVLEGMLLSNRKILEKVPVSFIKACTDVTGYGLLGHLHNLLRANGVSASIKVRDIPVYESIIGLKLLYQSRQYWHNREYADRFVKILLGLDEVSERVLFDSQVSGGLLMIMAHEKYNQIKKKIGERGETFAVIGEITNGQAGQISAY